MRLALVVALTVPLASVSGRALATPASQRPLVGRVASAARALGKSIRTLPGQLGIGTAGKGVEHGTSTPLQRVLAGGQVVAATAAVVSFAHLDHGWQYAAATAIAYAGYQLADLAGGVAHWGLDNYGDEHTPVLGTQIRTFQNHHLNPRIVATSAVPHLIAPLTMVGIPAMIALATTPNDHWVGKALALGFTAGFLLNPVAHKYSHQPQKSAGPVLKGLRALGLFVTPRTHLQGHHHAPFAQGYGVLTGLTNPLTDKLGLHRKLEAVVYHATGAIPNTWKEEGGGEIMRAALGAKAAAEVKLPAE